MVTIAAPADPAHVTHLFSDRLDAIRDTGEIEVSLGGRPFTIRREFLDDIESHKQTERIAHLRKALLIFHSPTDETVGIDNATAIFVAAKHPKSFVSLAGADHLLSRKEDAAYVAQCHRSLGRTLSRHAGCRWKISTRRADGVTVTETGQGKFQQTVRAGRHTLTGRRAGRAGRSRFRANALRPVAGRAWRLHVHDVAALCRHKGLPLERVSVALKHSRIHAADCETCETKEGKVDRIDRVLTLTGNLDAAAAQTACWKSPTNARFTGP